MFFPKFSSAPKLKTENKCFKKADDDYPKFETTVVYAMNRLQVGCRMAECVHNCEGLSVDAIVKFIKEHYSFLDGDIESQVRTALQSCVKNGTVCALKNGQYRLIGQASKDMLAFRMTRVRHGPKCCCLPFVKCFAGNKNRECPLMSSDVDCNQKLNHRGPTSFKCTKLKVRKKPKLKHCCPKNACGDMPSDEDSGGSSQEKNHSLSTVFFNPNYKKKRVRQETSCGQCGKTKNQP